MVGPDGKISVDDIDSISEHCIDTFDRLLVAIHRPDLDSPVRQYLAELPYDREVAKMRSDSRLKELALAKAVAKREKKAARRLKEASE